MGLLLLFVFIIIIITDIGDAQCFPHCYSYELAEQHLQQALIAAVHSTCCIVSLLKQFLVNWKQSELCRLSKANRGPAAVICPARASRD